MIRQGLSLHYRYAAADGFMLWAERRNEMNKGYLHHRANTMARIMTALGGLGAVAIVLLRVWISPSQRDMDTGLFATNWPVIGLMLLILLAGVGLYLHNLQGQVAAAEEEKTRLEEEVARMTAENEALASDISEGTTPEMMAELARKELGLVDPGTVFYNISNQD